MSKGAGRKTLEKGGTTKGAPASGVGSLSPEEAERAAAAFVPLWQFDEATFEAGRKLSAGDMSALASPAVPTIAASATLSAPSSQTTTTESNGAGAAAKAGETAPTSISFPIPTSTQAVVLEAVADSVILGPGIVAATPEPPAAAAPEPAIAAPPPAATPIAQPAPLAAPPPGPPTSKPARTEPPSSRRKADLPPPRAQMTSDSVLYPMPRRRGPMLAAIAVVGSAVAILAIYFVSTAMSAPAPVTAAPPSHAPPEPKINIPPPPPPDEAPAAATSVPTVAAAAPHPVTPTPPVLPPTPPPRSPVAAPPSPPVSRPAPARAPTSRPAAAKNPSPASHPGDIVRDNPF